MEDPRKCFLRPLQIELRRQGWTPERVTTRAWVSELVKAGIAVLPEAESILQNFGGLAIHPVRTTFDVVPGEMIHFDPITLVLSEVERIRGWEQRLAQRLTPLGVKRPSDEIVLLGEDGRVIGEWGNILVVYGSSFEDALESTLVLARRNPEMYRLTSEGELVPARGWLPSP